MIQIRRSDERGHADHGWLDAYHTFSFAAYFDPEHTHFGALRVLNQDRIAPGTGFGTHGHQDMEIVTWVLDGVLEHEDSMGNGSRIRPGDVQLMSAGTGVRHSEFNGSREDPLHLLQMWVLPREDGLSPRYEEKRIPEEERRGRLRLIVSPDGRDGSLTIGQDAALYAGSFGPGDRAEHALEAGRSAWVHVASGRLRINGIDLEAGDGAGIRSERSLSIEGLEEAEVVVWDLPEGESNR